MTDTESALRRAVAAAPEDLTVRQALCDYWDDDGNPRAELVRAQQELRRRGLQKFSEHCEPEHRARANVRCSACGALWAKDPDADGGQTWVCCSEVTCVRCVYAADDDTANEVPLATDDWRLLHAEFELRGRPEFRAVPVPSGNGGTYDLCGLSETFYNNAVRAGLRLPWRYPVVWTEGHVSGVICTLDDVYVAPTYYAEKGVTHYKPHRPTPWALDVVTWFPVYEFYVTDLAAQNVITVSHGNQWGWQPDGHTGARDHGAIPADLWSEAVNANDLEAWYDSDAEADEALALALGHFVRRHALIMKEKN